MSDFHSIIPYGSKVCHGSVTGVTCDTTVAGCDKDLAPSLEHSKHATLPSDVQQHIEDVIQLFWDTYGDIQCEKDAMDG